MWLRGAQLRAPLFICAKIERPSPPEKPSCKVRFFANRHSRKYRQKVTVTTLFPTAFHRVFQLLSQTAHVRFPGRKCTHSPLLKGSHTAAYTAEQGPSLPRPQHGLELPAKSSPKEQPEEADARLWRVSASSGVAAPLGCVIFFCFCRNCGLHTMCSVLSACARRGVVSPLLACSACCRNSRPPLVKTTNLPFSEIGWPSLVSAVQNVSRVLQKQQQFTPNSPGPL